MQIRGKLSDRSPADLLEWLHREKKNGVLRFWQGTVRKDVWFESGEVVSSGTSEPREFLGSYLIASGAITEDDFVRAYRTQLETKVLFGKVLVMLGRVTEKEVDVALRGKTEETIWDVFTWRDGLFEYDDGSKLSAQRLPLKVDVERLVEEGERRVIEWGVIRQTFPHVNVEVDVLMPGAQSLGPTETRILERLRNGVPVPQTMIESRLSSFLFLRKLDEMRKKKIVGVRRILDELPDAAVEAIKTDPGAMPEAAKPVDPGVADSQKFAAGKESLTASELKQRVPVLTIPKTELMKMKFSAEEGYLISRLDGVFDVATVVSLCPYKESLALSLLCGLASREIVRLQKD